jgi:ribosomal protein S18 acetylase RimI-like enzyme
VSAVASEWRVRRAVVADAAGIARVSVAAWREGYAGLMSAERLARLSVEELAATWRERLADVANPRTSLVAEQLGAIAGFVSVGPPRDADVVAEGHVGELWALYVDPLLWRRGAGAALFDRGLAELRKRRFEAVVLWVLRDNARARAFYERHGMAVDGAEKSPEGEGESLPHVRYRGTLEATDA